MLVHIQICEYEFHHCEIERQNSNNEFHNCKINFTSAKSNFKNKNNDFHNCNVDLIFCKNDFYPCRIYLEKVKIGNLSCSMYVYCSNICIYVYVR